MNFGDCPYDGCDGLLSFAVPDRAPAYAVVECEECKRPIWYRFSRFDPKAWTKEDFEREFEVDPIAKTITLRPVPGTIDPATGMAVGPNGELKRL